MQVNHQIENSAARCLGPVCWKVASGRTIRGLFVSFDIYNVWFDLNSFEKILDCKVLWIEKADFAWKFLKAQILQKVSELFVPNAVDCARVCVHFFLVGFIKFN
ncbi:hypothetical protein [Mycoplasma sp. 'Moose RK']|uniref:hypothetical protein n=1 Tax=Mycoplasma sp. 'Moose RK' TaxID=2780095 RepID=UPI0018C2845A|nr:hypothetical protein [Mycoplasma sp. 'Moose RK']MBG0730736.1 hypothetical protein [Mycoplasma sp. 'Moose RK']